jgi:hypothetical protein
MKNAKIPKVTIIILLSIVLPILIFYISSNLFLESKDQTNINYLSKNKIELKTLLLTVPYLTLNSKVFLLVKYMDLLIINWLIKSYSFSE